MELILRGRYLPVSLLGKGGFGTAFLAKDFDSPTQRRCVVKLFQPPVTLTPPQLATAQRLFNQEAIVLERLGLQHPRIPNLYAYFPLLVTNPLNNQSEELFYLVQEYVEGDDLEKLLDRQGRFSEPDIEKVLAAMLDVLGFVHDNGAIHRDVKPSNIIQGKDGKLSLLDFGAVKEVTTPTAGRRGPTTICSPDYAPPEQIMSGQVDQTSDLYALAATCVVLLTDRDSNQLRDPVSNRWNWQSSTQISTGLAQVLEKMLQPKPRDRFPNAAAVVEALTKNAQSTVSPQARATGRAIMGSSAQSAQSVSVTPSQPKPTPPLANPKVGSPANPKQSSPPVVPASAPVQLLSVPRFLGNAAFAGVEGGLLAVACLSTLGTTLVGGGAWLAMLAVLVALQLRRAIEGMDLVIIAGVTLAVIAFFSPLHSILGGGGWVPIAVIAMMAGGVMVIVAIVFRLIFSLLSRIM
ncbi:protein kinase domain [Synechococcus sp. PCC 7335]|nr:protein kinase domain [Synechococcus sp. PCC 7335]